MAMTLYLPEKFPFDKPPKKGDVEKFIVEATCEGEGDGKGWKYEINTIDGVPMDTAGKANAPGDDGEEGSEAEEAAESPDEEAAEGEAGEAAEESGAAPMPDAAAPAEADQSQSASPGAGFAKSVMKG